MADTTEQQRHLLAQMAELRSRIDPAVLERLREAADGGSAVQDSVPYDTEAARDVIQRFLAARSDGDAFKRKLRDALRRSTQ
ncbi:MAG: hypothetical protein ACTS3R_06295 [Inquilinaceae bacterium]